MATIQRGLIQRGDLAQWDGITKNASRADATGGTITGLTIGDEVDVLQVYGEGTNRTTAALTRALASLGTQNVALLFATGTWVIDSNVTIPSNLTTIVPAGCVFDVASGKTLTINGPIYRYAEAIGSGAGSVVAARDLGASNTIPGTTDMLAALDAAAALSGDVFLPNDSYLLSAKFQITGDITLRGENKERTRIEPEDFDDYVIEIGDGTSFGNCGSLERLHILGGGSSNLGLLHVQHDAAGGNPPAIWSFDNLLFQNAACPAIILDRMWDSVFRYIEILNCQGAGTDPSMAASVICNNDTNNIYFETLRQDGIGASVFVDNCGPIYIKSGKIDRGSAASQQFAAVTVDRGEPSPDDSFYGGSLVLENFYIGGVIDQWPIDLGGSLKLGNVLIDGGSNKAAAINDRRVWQQVDPLSFIGVTAPRIGPFISDLDLGHTRFNRSHPSVNTVTGAAVKSRIFPIRETENLTVSANGATTATTRNIATSLTAAVNGLYIGLYLVHNSNGYLSDQRRKITASFTDGQMTVLGTAALTTDGDYSIEYAGGHCTPIRADEVSLENGMDLFAVLNSGITIATPTYDSSSGDASYGMTVLDLDVTPSEDVRGCYLIDETDGIPYYIGYQSGDDVGVMYDVSGTINTAHTFSIVAGHKGGVRREGSYYVWDWAGRRQTMLAKTAHAAGFDADNMPLWDQIYMGGTASLA